MKYIKRWIVGIIVEDIRRGGEIAKAIEQRPVTVNVNHSHVHESAFVDSVLKAVATGQRQGRISRIV